MFITFEGGEGAGKSTQAARLAEKLRTRGRQVLLTREPGGAPGAEMLRDLLLRGTIAWSPAAETHLHFAARAEHLARTILPALDEGTIVICDRFADSTMAYQGYGLGADRSLIAGLTRLLPKQPDITLLLHVPYEVGNMRVVDRGGQPDRYETLDRGFHTRVAEGYREIARENSHRVVSVAGTDPPETVTDVVWEIVQRRLT